MEGLLWVAGAVALFVVVRMALHAYRMKTDHYYRYKVEEAEQEHQLREVGRKLQNSESEKVRELTDQLIRRK